MKIYGRWTEGIGMDSAIKLKPRCQVEDLYLPQRRRGNIKSRVEGEADTQEFPNCKAMEWKTCSGECELYKEERGVLEGEM